MSDERLAHIRRNLQHYALSANQASDYALELLAELDRLRAPAQLGSALVEAPRLASESNHEVVGPRVCVECKECLFTYSAEHSVEGERYDCPVCDGARMEAALQRIARKADDLAHASAMVGEQNDAACEIGDLARASLLAAFQQEDSRG